MDNNEIQKYINKRMRETGISSPSLEELNVFLSEYMQIRNTRPSDQFEGYSPRDMNYVLHRMLQTGCPVQLANFTDEDCARIPLFRQVKLLLGLIEKEGSLKLTQTGNLPVRIVQEVYSAGASDSSIERGFLKLRGEDNSISVQMTKIALLIMRAVKKQNNKLSLTKKGTQLLASDHNLTKELLATMLNMFNTAYFDSYSSRDIGVLGIGFTLILLNKYGKADRMGTFYSQKYFAAFPMLLEGVTDDYQPQAKTAANCYLLRSFDLLLYHLGFVKIEEIDRFKPTYRKTIRKTELFDRFIKVSPPKIKK